MRLLKTALIIGLCAPLLAGCDGLRQAAGLTKKSPDEFAVTTKAPLVIPPDFNLRPPLPGAAPTNQLDPTDNAQVALFSTAVDPQTVAAGLKGNYSPGEKMLLANAGVQKADPGVRSRLVADQRAALQNSNASFTDKVLGTAPTPDTGKPINGDLEISKGKKSTATKKDDSGGGWFDWL